MPSRCALATATFSTLVLNPMITAFDALASSTSLSVIGSNPRVDEFQFDLFGVDLFQRADHRLQRSLHVGLDDQTQVLALVARAEEILQGGALRRHQLLIAGVSIRCSLNSLA